MRRSALSIAVLGGIAVSMSAAPVAADAQYHGRPAPAYDGYRGGYGDRRVDYDRGYDARRGGGSRGDRYRCRRDGTGGAIVGAIAGGLLGNAVAGYGDRAAGTILGGVGGALAGRAIDRDC